MKNVIRNPYQHELNGSGTACEDGTSKAGAVPCAACQWVKDNVCVTCGTISLTMYSCDKTMEAYCAGCWVYTDCGTGYHGSHCMTTIHNGVD
jgi:hypothetical protein